MARTDAVVAERRRVSGSWPAWATPSRRRRPTSSGSPWEKTADFAAASAQAKVLVRPYGNDGARVTIGSPGENDAFSTSPARGYAADRTPGDGDQRGTSNDHREDSSRGQDLAATSASSSAAPLVRLNRLTEGPTPTWWPSSSSTTRPTASRTESARDHRRRRAFRPAQARRHHRRGHQRQHRHRAGDGRRGPRLHGDPDHARDHVHRNAG